MINERDMVITKGYFWPASREQAKKDYLGFAAICWKLYLASGEVVEQRLNQIMVMQSDHNQDGFTVSLPGRRTLRSRRRFETLFWDPKEYSDDLKAAAHALISNWMTRSGSTNFQDDYPEDSVSLFTYNFEDDSFSVKTRGRTSDEVAPTDREMAHVAREEDEVSGDIF